MLCSSTTDDAVTVLLALPLFAFFVFDFFALLLLGFLPPLAPPPGMPRTFFMIRFVTSVWSCLARSSRSLTSTAGLSYGVSFSCSASFSSSHALTLS